MRSRFRLQKRNPVLTACIAQNATDQPAIVRQYMRHVGEIRSGKNTQQVVLRALQFANSEPKGAFVAATSRTTFSICSADLLVRAGPVYVWAQREATEEHIDPKVIKDVRAQEVWSPIELNPLNKKGTFRSLCLPVPAQPDL